MKKGTRKALVVLLCGLSAAGCASSPCHVQHVVQVSEDDRQPYAALRTKMQPLGFHGIGQDVELDDGHVYVANFSWSTLSSGQQDGNMPPVTGDEITLCTLTASDGSKHFSLQYKNQKYVAEFVR